MVFVSFNAYVRGVRHWLEVGYMSFFVSVGHTHGSLSCFLIFSFT